VTGGCVYQVRFGAMKIKENLSNSMYCAGTGFVIRGVNSVHCNTMRHKSHCAICGMILSGYETSWNANISAKKGPALRSEDTPCLRDVLLIAT
jgi:ribosomal protein L34E